MTPRRDARAPAGWPATLAILVTLVTLAAVSAGCTTTTDGTATPAPTLGHAPKPLTRDALAGLLLSPRDVDEVTGAAGLRVVGSGTNMFLDRIADRDCLALWLTVEDAVYTGTGWLAVQRQELREDDENYDHIVYQAVVAFGDGQAAHDFYSGQLSSWPQCDNRLMNDRDLDMPEIRHGTNWSLGTAAENDGVVSMLISQEGGDGWACQRSLGVDNNVVIDVKVCAEGVNDQGPRIVTQIAEKVFAAE